MNNGSNTNFNGSAFGAAGFGGGLTIAGALVQGFLNARGAMMNARRQEAFRRREVRAAKREAFHNANAMQLGLRLNREVDKNAAMALAHAALRRELDRVKGFR